MAAHGGGCGSNPAVHIVVVAEVVVNVASKVLEVPCECYISFFELDDRGIW